MVGACAHLPDGGGELASAGGFVGVKHDARRNSHASPLYGFGRLSLGVFFLWWWMGVGDV